MNPRESIIVAAPTNRPNMVEAIIARIIRSIIISVQPALTSVSINLRLIAVTEMKTKNPNITSTSIKTVTAGLILFNVPTGLESITSGEDQAQRASPRIRNNVASIVVIIEERTISLLSGVSSLTVFTPTLEPEKPMYHT